MFHQDFLNSDQNHITSISRGYRLPRSSIFYSYSEANPDFRLEDFCNIYPNPVVDDLNVELLGLVQANWMAEILDMNGRVVISEDVGRKQNIRINLGHLPLGVYLLRLRSSAYQYSFLVRKVD